MATPTQHDVELRKALARANAFVGNGSRSVMISRAVVGGIILFVSLVLWVLRAMAVAA